MLVSFLLFFIPDFNLNMLKCMNSMGQRRHNKPADETNYLLVQQASALVSAADNLQRNLGPLYIQLHQIINPASVNSI